MIFPLHEVWLADDHDVVRARQIARHIALRLGFDHHDQIRIATAASEIARNAFRYAHSGVVRFHVDNDSRMLSVTVIDQGPGIPHLEKILAGEYRSNTGMGMGILGTKRLMDEFSIDPSSDGTCVRFAKSLPHDRPADLESLRLITGELALEHDPSPIEELQLQNRELLTTLNELRQRKEELLRINTELQDTNRGVVALYAELDERADYLRRASELKSGFLSNMSHEFRTPLNSILALTRMLLDRIDGDLTPEQDQQLRFIQRSAKELAEMVDDLLDLAKVEAGRLEVKPKAFEIADLFGALRGMLKPLLADSSLNLEFVPANEIPSLYTDEQKISQILRNFISNAIKFTSHGEVRISATIVGPEIEFAVTDTGIGISAADQRIIFEEFSQVDSSMQGQVKGTGLGLPLSRKLAELLGGRVEVISAIGAGSTFKLIVPATYAGELLLSESLLPLVHPDKKFVLIVEDNPETAFVYSRYLASAGYQSHAVGSIDEAKSVLCKIRPSAIILDILLRSETSWNFLREIKSAITGPPIPVLVMSVTDEEHKVFGLGADAFLRKPYQPEDFIGEISRITSLSIRPRILLIDDHEVSRYLLRESIPEHQYEIFEARSGREGIRMAHELRPSLIFLDFFMPDLTGAEVLRDLRNSRDIAHTPIILHSTKALEDSELRFFEDNGATLFSKQSLTLPDAPDRLRELLHSLIAHIRLEKGANA
jgi:signal transduction histidine kinase/CheY-like chemotaxis protein